MEHTKGPWIYDSTWSLIKGPEGEEICAVHSALHADSNRKRPEIATANARLIAAAPELLAALVELTTAVDYVRKNGGDILTSCSWTLAEKAIAKARRL